METEPVVFVKKLASFFPSEAGKGVRVYVETIRTIGAEDTVEQFYRAWKAGFPVSGESPVLGHSVPGSLSPGVIIQKYDSFCGFLPHRQAVDLSPVERRPCWHLMRDFPILIDGSVPLCREDLNGSFEKSGNVFLEKPELIWKRGEALYLSHCRKEYEDLCKICDEYYTYNF
jgi:spiro-SPASM protein